MITRDMVGRLLLTKEGPMNALIHVTFSFDEEDDPFAVQMIISGNDDSTDDVVWVFGRELLLRGSTSFIKFGNGDVRFWGDTTKNALGICLKNNDGHADLAVPLGEVIAFLEETTELVPVGSEDCETLLDEFLGEVLGG